MEVLSITVKTNEAAQSLKAFLRTIDYVETVNQVSDNAIQPESSLTKGQYKASEKPSDFAGIWKNDENRLTADEIRKQAWAMC